MTSLAAVTPPTRPDLTSEPTVALLLHGYGANAQDLATVAPRLAGDLPWVSLQAPQPVSGAGFAWFPIITPGNPAPETVDPALAAIWSWVDAHLQPTTSVVPIGFSQGGLIATELLRTRPGRVPVAVVLGGFIQGGPRPGDADLAARRPPVFWGRGADDTVIAESAVKRTTEWLPGHATLTERIYPGLGHGINAAEADDVRAFLSTALDRTGPVGP